jgi:hypothetical protein
MVVPVVIALARATGQRSADPAALAATFAASLGFMMPVSTPCNALVYGSGRVPLRAMMAGGAVIDVARHARRHGGHADRWELAAPGSSLLAARSESTLDDRAALVAPGHGSARRRRRHLHLRRACHAAAESTAAASCSFHGQTAAGEAAAADPHETPSRGGAIRRTAGRAGRRRCHAMEAAARRCIRIPRPPRRRWAQPSPR